MGGPLNTASNSKKVYKSALLGSYFGIFNVFYMFIPYLNSIIDSKGLFYTYLSVAIVILLTLLVVPLYYRNEYNYNLLKLRYLLFLGIYNLTFYVGLTYLLYKKFSVSLISSGTYLLILYVIFSIMSGYDILSSTFKGFFKIKRLYTRTFKKHLIINIIVGALAFLTGILLLLPQALS